MQQGCRAMEESWSHEKGTFRQSLLDSFFSKATVDAVYIKLLKGKEQTEISTGKYIWITLMYTSFKNFHIIGMKA